MLELTVQDAGARRRLHDIRDRVNDPRRLLNALVDDVQDYEREVFATQGHGQWAPLSTETIRIKGSSRVLVYSGSLLDELTGRGGIDISGDELTLTSSKPYARYLKDGARGMPRRDPVPPPESRDRRRFAGTLLDEIVHGRSR